MKEGDKTSVKRFRVVKYLYAKSVADALRRERDFAPDEVFVDDKWEGKSIADGEKVMGFKTS